MASPRRLPVMKCPAAMVTANEYLDARNRAWLDGQRRLWLDAELEGSVQARLNVMLSLPPETPDPVYRTPADVIAFAERTAGQVLRRELDTRLAAEAHENAALALKAMELTAWATIEALRRSVLGRRRG